jgi:hypothetical protein
MPGSCLVRSVAHSSLKAAAGLMDTVIARVKKVARKRHPEWRIG